MEMICPMCGDIGFDNAFVYCVKCLNAAIHRYCLDVIPEAVDEYVRWVCDACEAEEKARDDDDDVILSHNRGGIFSKNIQTEEHLHKEGVDVDQSYDETLMQFLQRKKAKDNKCRKKRRVKKSTVEKIYEHSTPSVEPSKSKQNVGLTLENEESKDAEKDFQENSSAEPIVEPIWRGGFNIWNEKCELMDGIIAHMSSKACEKVYEESTQFQSVLRFEMLRKTDVWPKGFEKSPPTGDNIALYFFPSEISEKKYDELVVEMTRKELALKAFLKDAELLIFTSTELPLPYWRFQGKYYLWGVFRGKQNNSQPHTNTYREDLQNDNYAHSEGENGAETRKCGKRKRPLTRLSNSASNDLGSF